jgi:3-phosphoshikimate 1-carboxyvinyltransferase
MATTTPCSNRSKTPAKTRANWSMAQAAEVMFTTAFLDMPPLATCGWQRGAAGLQEHLQPRAAAVGAVRRPDHAARPARLGRHPGDAAALRTSACDVQRTQRHHASRSTAWPGQLPQRQADLFLGNAGTAMRPLTAALAVLGGDFTLRGIPRMHERPIGDLVDALRQLGCAIDYLERDGYPPLRIGQPRLRWTRRSGARRRVEPVPDRAADGLATGGPVRTSSSTSRAN